MHPSQHSSLIARGKAFFGTPRGIQLNLWVSYFIFWGGAAAFMPYISVYYESVGLKGSQIGQLSSIPFFISMISSILFAFLSDVSKKHKTVLRLCVLGMIGVMALFPFAKSFVSFLPIVVVYSIINAPFNSIMDQTTLTSLENPQNYGKIRVGGSIGWGIMVLVTGFLIDHLGLGLKVIFFVEIFFLGLFLINTINMPDTRRKHSDPDEPAPTISMIWEMLRLPGFLPFLAMIIIWGIGESAIGSFLFLHIQSLGGSSTLMGVALSISLVGEIVTFSIADKLQVKLGPFKMMLLSYLVLFTWLFGLSVIKNPNAIPFFQIFGGSGFALIQSGGVAYVNARAPKSLGTTAQAIRGGIYSGLGVGTGSLISGFIYEHSGSVVLFRQMAYFVITGFAIGVLLYIKNNRKKSAPQG
ncbi:MAG: transporter, family, 3-phenylpropionic acid transporter [Chloroflexota bacterium]|nr:transporter, family, 3-phenylpropionic acid transporter [Chloroflexota bacterium]